MSIRSLILASSALPLLPPMAGSTKIYAADYAGYLYKSVG